MAGPADSGTGKGKGKGKSRDGVGSSVSGSAARGDTDITPPSRTSASSPPSLAPYSSSAVAEMEAPRAKTVCLFALLVSALALARSFLLPFPSSYNGARRAEVPAYLEEDLIRLVLAEQLEGISANIKKEDRSFDEMRKRRAAAWKEIQGFEERLRASAEEMVELEGLGKAVHEDNSGDAGLATEVSKAQDSLRDLHRSVAEELDGFKRQLEIQAETMRGARDELTMAGRLAGREEDRLTAAVHENLESKLEETLNELSGFYASVERTVEALSPDIISAEELEALLESAAEPSDGTDATGENGGGGDGPATKDRIRDLSEAAVDLAVQEMIAGGGASSGDKEEECVSEQAFRAEVDAAIYRLVADGTGRRDYANAAIGGKVLTSRGLVSDTYTPKSWWAPSQFWHRAGVENGIGPVKSVISEDSSLGACWAMSGSVGFVTIELAEAITVDGVSLEHASRMITVESSSTPREFQVVGMRELGDPFPVTLGNWVYHIDGSPIQTFPIEPLGVKFSVIQLKILSNWGNPDFTCLYRVRVHGRGSD